MDRTIRSWPHALSSTVVTSARMVKKAGLRFDAAREPGSRHIRVSRRRVGGDLTSADAVAPIGVRYAAANASLLATASACKRAAVKAARASTPKSVLGLRRTGRLGDLGGDAAARRREQQPRRSRACPLRGSSKRAFWSVRPLATKAGSLSDFCASAAWGYPTRP